jgi:site-specific recombinase XerC
MRQRTGPISTAVNLRSQCYWNRFVDHLTYEKRYSPHTVSAYQRICNSSQDLSWPASEYEPA